MKIPAQHNVQLRQLLSMIHNIWRHYPDRDWQMLGQKALWIATLAGAANSGVSFEAIRKAHTTLWLVWNQEVPIEEGLIQLDALTNERRDENV